MVLTWTLLILCLSISNLLDTTSGRSCNGCHRNYTDDSYFDNAYGESFNVGIEDGSQSVSSDPSISSLQLTHVFVHQRPKRRSPFGVKKLSTNQDHSPFIRLDYKPPCPAAAQKSSIIVQRSSPMMQESSSSVRPITDDDGDDMCSSCDPSPLILKKRIDNKGLNILNTKVP